MAAGLALREASIGRKVSTFNRLGQPDGQDDGPTYGRASEGGRAGAWPGNRQRRALKYLQEMGRTRRDWGLRPARSSSVK